MTHESIASRILLLRGQRVMLDADLAELYGVPTKALNQAVRRNSRRFPSDFMFQLSLAEKQEVVTSCDHLARLNCERWLRCCGSWLGPRNRRRSGRSGL